MIVLIFLVSCHVLTRFNSGDTLVKLLMHSSDDVTCVALEALLAIFTNGNLEQKKVSIVNLSNIYTCCHICKLIISKISVQNAK